MEATVKKIACLIVASLLIGCGGGGGGGGGNTTPTTTVLEGKWVYSSDGHPTGGACGLDAHGNYGERMTIVFNNNQYTSKYEACVILSGNTGAYFETDSETGTFVIGEIVLYDSTFPEYQMTAIDFRSQTTIYTSYNLTDNNLHIAIPYPPDDGTTPDKRAISIATFWDSASQSLVTNPTYVKQ
jgi:hypothetical protein